MLKRARKSLNTCKERHALPFNLPKHQLFASQQRSVSRCSQATNCGPRASRMLCSCNLRYTCGNPHVNTRISGTRAPCPHKQKGGIHGIVPLWGVRTETQQKPANSINDLPPPAYLASQPELPAS